MQIPRLQKALSLTLAAALAACGSSGPTSSMEEAVSTSAVDPGNAGGNKFVTVMTRNLYIGGAVEPFFDPGVTTSDIPGLAAHLWATVQATDFFERAGAIADEIQLTGAALVGLQEAALWRTQFPPDSFQPDGGQPAELVAYDFIDILLTELQARGLSYDVVTLRENIDVETVAIPPFLDVRLTDRDAILARDDVKVEATADGTFAASVTVPIGGPGGPTVAVIRGWSTALVKIQGVEFVFANTHLEPFSPVIQGFQAAELYGILSNESRPVVLVGDFNSGPGGSLGTYNLFTGGGYVDAAPPGGNEFTCCQAENLLNPVSILDERVDLVLLKGALTAQQVVVVGEDAAADRTDSGLWPSDHAGVAATIRLENPKFFALH